MSEDSLKWLRDIFDKLDYLDLIKLYEVHQLLDDDMLQLLDGKWKTIQEEGKPVSEDRIRASLKAPPDFRLPKNSPPELPSGWVWAVPSFPWKVLAESVEGRGTAWYGINGYGTPGYGGNVENIVATAVCYRYQLERSLREND